MAASLASSRRDEEDRRERALERERMEKVKFRTAVVAAGPKYDGTTVF